MNMNLFTFDHSGQLLIEEMKITGNVWNAHLGFGLLVMAFCSLLFKVTVSAHGLLVLFD